MYLTNGLKGNVCVKEMEGGSVCVCVIICYLEIGFLFFNRIFKSNASSNGPIIGYRKQPLASW